MKKIIILPYLYLIFIAGMCQNTGISLKPLVSTGIYQTISYFGKLDKYSAKLQGTTYSVGLGTDLLFLSKYNLHIGVEYLHDKYSRVESDANYIFFTQSGDIRIVDRTNMINIPIWLGITLFDWEKVILMGSLSLDNHMYKRERKYKPISFTEPVVTDFKRDFSDIYGGISFNIQYFISEKIYLEFIPFFKLDFYQDFKVENYQTGGMIGISYRWK